MPSTPSASTRPRPRTIDPGAVGQRGVGLPESWLRGILAGAEAVMGTWLLVVIPAIAVYIATAAAPELGSASWLEAARIGTGVWLTAHGAHLQVGEVTFTLLPLGVSLMAFALTAAAIRRASLETWAGAAFAVGTYLAGTLLLTKVAGAPGAFRAVGGALVVPVAAALWGMRKSYPRLPGWVQKFDKGVRARVNGRIDSLPKTAQIRQFLNQAGAAISAGSATAVRVLAGIFTLATVGVVVSVVTGLPLILAVHDRLDADLVSTIVLTGAQVLMLPTMIIWSAGYLSGAGFSLGTGTLYSPAEVVGAPLPAIPVLGALPNPENAPLPIVGYVFLLIGGLAGWYLHRRIKQGHKGVPRLATVLGGVVTATAIIAVTIFILASLASGGFGPGRLATDVGPLGGEFLGAVVWQTALPMTVVVIAVHPATHRLLRRGWRKAVQLVGRRDAA